MRSYDSIILILVGTGVVVSIAVWMYWISARLKAIERAVFTIVDNTNALREVINLLRSIDGNTSLLGGIRRAFGSRDRKKST